MNSKEPTMTTERKARELLADEYGVDIAYFGNDPVPLDVALRAIARALESAGQGEAQAGGVVEIEPGVKLPVWLLDYAQKIQLYMKANLPGPWRIGGIQSHDYALATHAQPKAPESKAGGEVARKPDGYAYRYPSTTGEGTVIRFTCGQDINGSRAIEAIPYFYGTPPAKVPEGYVLVPEIATEEMVEAIIDQGRHGGDEISHTTAHMIWADAVIAWQHRANRAAAPAPKEGV